MSAARMLGGVMAPLSQRWMAQRAQHKNRIQCLLGRLLNDCEKRRLPHNEAGEEKSEKPFREPADGVECAIQIEVRKIAVPQNGLQPVLDLPFQVFELLTRYVDRLVSRNRELLAHQVD